MRQFAPPLEASVSRTRHMRFDGRPANEEQEDRAVLLLTTDLAAVASGGRIQYRQRQARGRLEFTLATGRHRQERVFEDHERAISRARSLSSSATRIAVCARARAPSRTVRSASGVTHAAGELGLVVHRTVRGDHDQRVDRRDDQRNVGHVRGDGRTIDALIVEFKASSECFGGCCDSAPGGRRRTPCAKRHSRSLRCAVTHRSPRRRLRSRR